MSYIDYLENKKTKREKLTRREYRLLSKALEEKEEAKTFEEWELEYDGVLKE